jgi:ferritin-like metal-binding protein YciE
MVTPEIQDNCLIQHDYLVSKSKEISLTEARKKGDIQGFIEQHKPESKGDIEKLDKALKRSVSQRSKGVRKRGSDD